MADAGLVREAKDAAFEDYEFGEGVVVEDYDGWESLGLRSTRNVYVRCDEDGADEATRRLRFVVELGADGAVVSAEALDDKGSVWGVLPEEKSVKSLASRGESG